MFQSKDISQLSHPDGIIIVPVANETLHSKDGIEIEQLPVESSKQCIFDSYVTILPTIPESFNDIPIPYIRQCGIKDAMDSLAKHFNCTDYRNNLVQFWFLDILVDCIWRLQDEFHLSVEHQQIVLEWWLFILKLIINRSDMTRDLFFNIFNETIIVAEEYILSHGPLKPIPSNLFELLTEMENEKASKETLTSSSRSSSNHVPANNNQYIAIKYENGIQIFKLPSGMAANIDCHSISTISVESIETVKKESQKDFDVISDESSIEFYKADLSTPSRFKSLTELQPIEGQFVKIETSENRSEQYWYKVPRIQRRIIPKCPTETILLKPSANESARDKSDTAIFETFYKYNLWQLQNEYMTNSMLGWTPSLDDTVQNDKKSPAQKNTFTFNMNQFRKAEMETNVFINSYLILIVKELISDCFSTNFSFELIKKSLKHAERLITQQIISEWLIPKTIKVEIKRPKPKKEKMKQSDKVKSSPKTKSASKKSKEPVKNKDKKSPSKSKSSKEGKTSKKLTKEEKMELEKKRKEEAELEKQRIKEEENKRFMFPLKDAVDDEFFHSIFPNYKQKKKTLDKKSTKSKK